MTIHPTPSPKWIVLFSKADQSFHLKFNDVDLLLIAISRAKSIGYKTKTIPAQFRG
jgi:hypothetical protein